MQSRRVVVVPSGLPDVPLAALGGETVLQAARLPNLDALARRGPVGAARNLVEDSPLFGTEPYLMLLGLEPGEVSPGRGTLEAAGLGVSLEERDAAFCCNLVSSDGERLLDPTAHQVNSSTAQALIAYLDEVLGSRRFRFYPGVGYRQVMVWRDFAGEVSCNAPFGHRGEAFEALLPEGDGEERLAQLILDSYDILSSHPFNRGREVEEAPANMIWPWGQGRPVELPDFSLRWGIAAAAVAAVPLFKGLARLSAIRVVEVAGATGYPDTDYAGKVQATLRASAEHEVVFLHIAAANEAALSQQIESKIRAAEGFDSLVVKPLLDGLAEGGDFRVLFLPDHATSTESGLPTRDPVPWVLFDSQQSGGPNSGEFAEEIVREHGSDAEEGHSLVRRWILT